MAGSPGRRAFGKAAAAMIVVVMVLMVAGLGTLLSEEPISSDLTTPASSSAPAGCVFVTQQVQPSTTIDDTYTGCLTPGSSGGYLIAVDDPNGMTLGATVTAEYPVTVTIAGAQVGGLQSGGEVLYSVNGTSANPSGIILAPRSGYSVTVANIGGENNTVTLSLDLRDIPGGRQ